MGKVKHARFGPSTLDALRKCIRFRYDDSDADAASEGTMLHEALETGCLAGLDDEQKDAVQKILDYAESLKEGKPDDWVHLRECKILLQDLTYGTADIILIHKTEPIAHVADGKFTRVEGDHDTQVQAYGSGLVEMIRDRIPITDHDGNVLFDPDNVAYAELERVITHVVAPRTRTIGREEYEAKQLLELTRQDIIELYERVDDPFLPPTPDETLCGKCARAAKCPALNAVVKAAAPELGLPLPSDFDPSALVSAENRARAHILAGAFTKWAEQVKKNNNEFARQGGEVPGFTLRGRSTGMRIPKEYTAIAFDLLRQKGYTEDTLLEACSLALGALVKAEAADSSRTEAEIKEELHEILADYVSEGRTEFLQKSKRISDVKLLEQINNG